MTLLEQINAYKESATELKQKYVNYIKDKSISLDDRWRVFESAPTDWKIHERYLQHFDVEDELLGRDILWWDDFDIEKGQTVNMQEWVNDLSNLKVLRAWGYEGDEVANAFKEEVLSMNLGLFKYDW